MENKNKKNESKIILGEFNCTMDKMNEDGGNKKQRRCRSNYALSKLIVDNGLKDLWRRENLGSSEFTHYDTFSGTRYRIDRIYADIKIAGNSKINHIVVSFTDHCNDISVDRN